MSAKTDATIRSSAYEAIEAIELTGFTFEGITKEGAAFSDGTSTIVVKVVVKKEDFDLADAVSEHTEAVEKATAKALAAASKKASK